MVPQLGKYVVVRPRSDGTYRVSFEVPERLRPPNWPATLPLPRERRAGNLCNPAECAQISQEAAILYEELLKQKAGTAVQNMRPRTWRTLIALYTESSRFVELADTTKVVYSKTLRQIQAYFDVHQNLRPSTITESDVEGMLANWNHSVDAKYQIYNVLKGVVGKAIKEGWRDTDPLAEIICKQRTRAERKVLIWEQIDVDALSAACIRDGLPVIADIIHTGWEIGQRLTDIRLFRFGEEYQDGVFRFYQSKTDQYVTIPANERLRARLTTKTKGDYLFLDAFTGKPFTALALGEKFARTRDALPVYRTRRLCLRNLRHSCVVQLARAGCTIPEIASITGHCLGSVDTILQHYLPRDNVLAFHAIEKRRRMADNMAANCDTAA